MKIGLTGDIGSGKSTALQIFGEEGFFTLSTDAIVHDLLREDKPLIRLIVDEFSPDVVTETRGVDRKKLGEIIFDSPQKRSKLESLIHPRVREVWQRAVDEVDERAIVVEIPLLFEKRLEKHFDYSVTVYSSLDIKIERLRGRNMTEVAIRARLDAQLDQESKAKQSDFLIFNNGTQDFLREQIKHCILRMKAQL